MSGSGDNTQLTSEDSSEDIPAKTLESCNENWLCISEIYEKFQRPGFYDFDFSTLNHLPRHWFTFQTERSANLFLLHIHVGMSFYSAYPAIVSLSCSGTMSIDKKSNIVKLSSTTKPYEINQSKDLRNWSYLTTFAFNNFDVDLLKNKKLSIAVKILGPEKCNSIHFADQVKAKHDLEALLRNPFGADYIIESSDGVKFNAHKEVLAAHSKVFEAMFKEDNRNIHHDDGDYMVQDVDNDDLYCFLEFMYTGTIKDMNKCSPLVMLQLSDKYEVHGLRELSEAMIIQKLDIENALNILVWSDLYNSSPVKLATMTFIKQHPEVFESSDFKEIKNIDLIHELTQFVATKV